MPKNHEVAQELRKLADALDVQPEQEAVQPSVYFSCKYKDDGKELFLGLAKLLPRPLKKSDGFDHSEMVLSYSSNALLINTSIERSKVCRMIEPAREAKFECEPLLSAEEEGSLA